MKNRDFGLLASGFRIVRFNGQEIKSHAGVMELADVTDSKSVGLITRVGSSPTTGTKSVAVNDTIEGSCFTGEINDVHRARTLFCVNFQLALDFVLI